MKKGLDNWHEKYNADMNAVHEELTNKMNKTTPTEYPFALHSGYEDNTLFHSLFWKTQEKIVCFMMNITARSEFTAEYQSVATLPEGFHPKAILLVPCRVARTSPDIVGTGLLIVNTTGVIQVSSGTVTNTNLCYSGAISFLAQ